MGKLTMLALGIVEQAFGAAGVPVGARLRQLAQPKIVCEVERQLWTQWLDVSSACVFGEKMSVK